MYSEIMIENVNMRIKGGINAEHHIAFLEKKLAFYIIKSIKQLMNFVNICSIYVIGHIF